MMRGRFLLSAALMAAVAAFAARPAQAHGDLVALAAAYAPGTIVVKTGERHLYLVVGAGQAIRYPVGVGRAGQQWSGTSVIDAKYVSPDWAPPPAIRRENPKLPPTAASACSTKTSRICLVGSGLGRRWWWSDRQTPDDRRRIRARRGDCDPSSVVRLPSSASAPRAAPAAVVSAREAA